MEDKDFRALTDMFESDGWKIYQDEHTELEEFATKGAVDNAPDGDTWQYLRGRLHGLRAVIGYENYVRVSYQQQLDDQEEDAAAI